jgi:hypothetical protein
MLILIPTGTSTIFGVFQAMTVSPVLRYDHREKSKAASKAAQAFVPGIMGLCGRERFCR